MTLIVGRVSEGRIDLIADSALTPQDGSILNAFTNGCLKLYLISPTLAFGFADNVTSFQDACSKLFEKTTPEELIDFVLVKQKSGWSVELIVASATPARLWTIKNGVVSESLAGFIGDEKAFSAFQSHYHRDDSSTEPVPLRMRDAFNAVVADPAHPTVAGVVIPLSARNGRFEYMPYASVFAASDCAPWS